MDRGGDAEGSFSLFIRNNLKFVVSGSIFFLQCSFVMAFCSLSVQLAYIFHVARSHDLRRRLLLHFLYLFVCVVGPFPRCSLMIPIFLPEFAGGCEHIGHDRL